MVAPAGPVAAALPISPHGHEADDREADGREELLAAVGFGLKDVALAERLVASDRLGLDELEAFARLSDQMGRLGIDYKKLGVGWTHPDSRIEYRRGAHNSFALSRERREESLASLRSLAQRHADADSSVKLDCRADLVDAFLKGIGVASDVFAAWAPQFEQGLLPALRQELVMPLRALNEACKYSTFRGDALPRGEINDAVRQITRAVIEGRYRDWRYSGSKACTYQLEGLTDAQKKVWVSSKPTRAPIEDVGCSLVVHEGKPEAKELDYFWATKIGGPSHGFDYESQCLLPLLCNARHKVVFVEDPAWPQHPAGRAHLRLLWTAGGQPRLWLEAVNADFAALREEGPMHSSFWTSAVVVHVMLKADAMGVALSLNSELSVMAEALMPADGCLTHSCHEDLVLRPSNGVVEASDYLSERHDWHQVREEVVPSGVRCLYTPATKEDIIRALPAVPRSVSSTSKPAQTSEPNVSSTARPVSPIRMKVTSLPASPGVAAAVVKGIVISTAKPVQSSDNDVNKSVPIDFMRPATSDRGGSKPVTAIEVVAVPQASPARHAQVVAVVQAGRQADPLQSSSQTSAKPSATFSDSFSEQFSEVRGHNFTEETTRLAANGNLKRLSDTGLQPEPSTPAVAAALDSLDEQLRRLRESQDVRLAPLFTTASPIAPAPMPTILLASPIGLAPIAIGSSEEVPSAGSGYADTADSDARRNNAKKPVWSSQKPDSTAQVQVKVHLPAPKVNLPLPIVSLPQVALPKSTTAPARRQTVVAQEVILVATSAATVRQTVVAEEVDTFSSPRLADSCS